MEWDFRNIKTTLGMEPLRCKTPEMAIKELWVYLLAYNLTRLLMAQAALLADQIPRQLSFKHTVQTWMAWQQRGGGTRDAVCINALLVLIAEPRLGLRPGRTERRALKRQLKPFPLSIVAYMFAVYPCEDQPPGKSKTTTEDTEESNTIKALSFLIFSVSFVVNGLFPWW